MNSNGNHKESQKDPRDWAATLAQSINSAEKCVSKFEEKLEDTTITHKDDIAPWEDPPAPPRQFLKIPEKKTLKNFFIRLAALMIMATSLYFLGKWFFTGNTIECDDCLVSLAPDREDYKSVENYVRYIVDKFRTRGLDEIESKWVEVPPEFKRQAKTGLSSLAASSFKVDAISVDKVSTYGVECASFDNPRSVFIEVVRQKSGKNTIYRLQRIY